MTESIVTPEFRKLLLCVNMEPKSVLLAYCMDRKWQTPIRMERRFAALVPRHPFYTLSTMLQEKVDKTFIPLGYARKERISATYGQKYALTEEGYQQQRRAAYALVWAVDHDQSLYTFLGQSQAQGPRASPETRVCILETLATSGPASKTELLERLGGSTAPFSLHLHKLHALGLIDYQHAQPDERGWSQYLWNKGTPDDMQPVRYPRLMKRMAATLHKSDKAMNVYDIMKALRLEPRHGNKCMVNHTLANLEIQGLVKSGLNRLHKSEVSILPPGEEFLEFTRTLADGDATVRQAWEKLENPLTRAKYASSGVALYENVTSRLRPLASSEREETALKLFGKKTRLRPRDAATLLSWSFAVTEACFRNMKRKGILRTEREGAGTHYFL